MIEALDIDSLVYLLSIFTISFMRMRVIPWTDITNIDLLLATHKFPSEIIDTMTASERKALALHRSPRRGYESWKQVVVDASQWTDGRLTELCKLLDRTITSAAKTRQAILNDQLRRVKKIVDDGQSEAVDLARAIEAQIRRNSTDDIGAQEE